jgi:hypothetical protein
MLRKSTICPGQDIDKERQLLDVFGVKKPKEKFYSVRITKILERTVTAKAYP